MWISAESFGWATYHYGNWMYDRYQGWVWIPGLDWGPAWVDWQEGGRVRSRRAESFVFNIEARKVLPSTPWIFTGSVFEDGEFKALAEQSLVMTYWDPWGIINLPLPCGSNDEILVVTILYERSQYGS